MALTLDTDARVVAYGHRDDIDAALGFWPGSKGGHHAHEGTKRAIIAPDADGVNGLWLPGIDDNYASAPVISAYNSTTSQRIELRVNLDDYTPILQKALFSIDDLKTALLLDASGVLNCFNNSVNVANSSSAVSLTGKGWLALEMTVGAGSGVATFEESITDTNDPDSVSWSQISTHTGLTIAPITHTGHKLEVGVRDSGKDNPSNGFFSRVRYIVDGVVQFDKDFTKDEVGAVTGTEDSANAATVTINQSAATANDPSPRIIPTGWDQGLRCNGVAGNVTSIDSNSADLTTATSYGYIWCGTPDSWRPAAHYGLCGRGSTSRALWLLAGGTLRAEHFLNVSGKVVADATALMPDDGVHRSVMFKHIFATGITTFYYATGTVTDPDSDAWVQLGDPVDISDTNTLAGNDVFCLCSNHATNGTSHPVAWCAAGYLVRNGTVINGLDFTDTSITQGAATATDAIDSGKTWTFTRSATGMVMDIIAHSEYQGSTDDVMLIPNHADIDFADEDAVLLTVWRNWLEGTAAVVMSGRDGDNVGDAGLHLGLNSSEQPWAEGSDGAAESVDVHTALTSGTRYTIAAQRDASADEIEAITEGTGSGSPGTTALGSLLSGEDVGLFAHPDGTRPATGFLSAWAIIKPAGTNLTSEEWATFISELTTAKPSGGGDGDWNTRNGTPSWRRGGRMYPVGRLG